MVTDTFSVSIYANSIDTVHSYADTVRGALNGYAGDLGGYEVLSVEVTDQDEDYNPGTGQGDDGEHVVTLTIVVEH
jgi:hypothetical protein